MYAENRLSPNTWNVGDTVKIGERLTFRAHTVYPDVLFEVVDCVDQQGSEDRKGVSAGGRAMSSQLQDYFEEAVETVARLLYARNRTPREPGWMDLEPRMREGAIRDARVVIDLWIKVSSPCLWCHGTGRTADLHPCRVCGGVGFQRFNEPEEELDLMSLCDCEFCARPLRDHDEEEAG